MTLKQITTASLIALIATGALAATVSAQSATETAISREQAIEIALGVAPGDVREVELEREDGTQVFEIEILAADGTETEVEISADTGEVLEVEVEDDDDDDNDDDDDDNDDDKDDA